MDMDRLYAAECVDFMRGMAAGSVDLTVTSPPYDTLRNYKGYDFDFERIADALFRVTASGGVVVWVVGDRIISIQRFPRRNWPRNIS